MKIAFAPHPNSLLRWNGGEGRVRGSLVAMEAMTYDRALADALRFEHQVVGIPFAEGGIEIIGKTYSELK
jgi:hypothetical protein